MGTILRSSDSQPRARRVLAALFLSGVVASGAPVASAGSLDEVQVVGRVALESPRTRAPETQHWDSASAQLVVNPISRHGYRLFTVGGEQARRAIVIRAFDLDSFKTTSSIEIPMTTSGDMLDVWGGVYAGMPVAVDRVGRRLFVSVYRAGDSVELLVIDEDRMEAGDPAPFHRVVYPASPRVMVRGLGFYRDGGVSKLLVNYAPGPPFVQMVVRQWDVERMLSGRGQYEDWDHPVAGCSSWLPATNQIPVWRSRSQLFMACMPTGFGNRAAVVVSLGVTGAPVPGSEQIFRGPPGNGRAILADPVGGRLHVLGERGQAQELWTFDFGTQRWVGRSGVATGKVEHNSFGIDESSGRVYVHGPHQIVVEGGRSIVIAGGLMSVEGRLTPVPQPRLYPALAYPSRTPIVVDDRPGHRTRVFLRRVSLQDPNPASGERPRMHKHPSYPSGQMRALPSEQFWLVVEDRLGVAKDVSVGDRDRLTVDVAPAEGVTDASFEASSSAWAARVRLVSGARGVPATCAPFNRVVTAAWLPDAKLTEFEQLGRAIAVDVDEVSKQDVASPASRCQPTQAFPVSLDPAYGTADTVGAKWDVAEAACSGHETTRGRYDRVPAVLELSSMSSCSSALITAESSASVGLSGVVKIADSFSATTVRREADRVRVETLTRLSGIVIAAPGQPIRIDGIETKATAVSSGRPGDSGVSRASFTRTICGVHAVGVSTNRCYTDVHDAGCASNVNEEHGRFCRDEITALAAVLSQALGGRGFVRAPTPDPEYLQGSPGGYVATVQKRAGDQFDDQLLNGDYSREVPSLEIIREDDGRRQVIQLAGVRTLTSYGIYCLPPRMFDSSGSGCVLAASADEREYQNDPPVGSPGLDPFDPADGFTPPGDPFTGSESPPRVLADSSDGVIWRVLMVRAPREGLLVAIAWFSLAAPLLLGVRRRRALASVHQESNT